MNTIVKSHDPRWPTLVSKVRAVAQILCGQMPREKLEELAADRNRARSENQVDFSDSVELYGSIAFIYAPGQYENARNWGNRKYDVAVIYDDRRQTENDIQKRWSVVRKEFPHKVFDRWGFQDAINQAEAKARGVSLEELTARGTLWGGNKNIVSSPQGVGFETKLTKERILGIVREHYESGRVS